MLRNGRRLGSAAVVAWTLLFWFVLPAPVVLLDSFHSSLPPGILDGDDDDDALTSLPDLDFKPLAAIPSPPPDLPPCGAGLASVEAPLLAPAVSAQPPPSRSPPLL